MINLFINSALTNNVMLYKFLGIDNLLDETKDEDKLLIFSLWLGLLITIAAICNYFIYTFILVAFNLEYLKLICFMIVIMCLAYLLSKEKVLVLANTASLGVSLLAVANNYNLVETIIFSLGSSLGLILVLFILTTLNGRISKTRLPRSLKGLPIMLIILGILSILFGRFGIK